MTVETNPQGSLVELLKSLPPDRITEFVQSIRAIVDEAIDESLPVAIDQALEKAGHTNEVKGLVQLIAAKSNDSKDEVVRKALTLYGLALDAMEKGNKLVIVSPDDVIVHDVVGFESALETLVPAAH